MVSGRTELLIAGVAALSLIATATDLARGRIYNWLTLPGLLAGLALAAWTGGGSALGDSLLGVLCALVAYGILFRLGVMGGGDVKLLMALGAWGGLKFTAEVAVLGVLLGGAMALVILIAKGRLGDFVRRMKRSLMSVLVKELEFEAPKLDHKSTLPFGLAISGAALWSVWAHPLKGWLPW